MTAELSAYCRSVFMEDILKWKAASFTTSWYCACWLADCHTIMLLVKHFFYFNSPTKSKDLLWKGLIDKQNFCCTFPFDFYRLPLNFLTDYSSVLYSFLFTATKQYLEGENRRPVMHSITSTPHSVSLSLWGRQGSLSAHTAGLQVPVGHDGQSTYAWVLLPVAEIYRQQQSQWGYRGEGTTTCSSLANFTSHTHTQAHTTLTLSHNWLA